MSQAEFEDKVHFYYCALLALKFAEKYQAVRSPAAQRVFLMRWLAKASSKRLFPREAQQEILWLRKTMHHGGPLFDIEQLLLTIYEQTRRLRVEPAQA